MWWQSRANPRLSCLDGWGSWEVRVRSKEREEGGEEWKQGGDHAGGGDAYGDVISSSGGVGWCGWLGLEVLVVKL